MKDGQRGILIIAIVLLGVGEVVWNARRAVVHYQQQVLAASAHLPVSGPASSPLPKGHVFTRAETYTFLDAAKKAEAIADPLQRCLAYPDPPASHWAHDAVVAYCQYRNQPVPTFAEIDQWIRAGRADEVDRRFAAMLQAERTDPGARDRVDATFYRDFHDGSLAVRSTLDAWKRAAPNSAFALAASGYAYVEMAFDARGQQYLSDTPQGNIDAMDKLLAEGDADLRRAIALNPRIVPAYVAMIQAGGLALGRVYALDAAWRGLAVAPDDFSIQSMLMWLREPSWGGSLAQMDELARQAGARAGHNPLLKMLASARPAYQVRHCDCDKAAQIAAYPAAFDQLPLSTDLSNAGGMAWGVDRPTSAIYLSEALRFNPSLSEDRLQRVYDLVEFDEPDWAVAEGNTLVKGARPNAVFLAARAFAYQNSNDLPHAIDDLRSAYAMQPDNRQVQVNLAEDYMQTKQWDKAWAVVDAMTTAHPEEPYGWFMRAHIQRYQPRPGLKDTVAYFDQHFGHDPKWARATVQMDALLVLSQHSGSQLGKAAAAATKHAHS
jgi:tetratricopeptide (TPR) repeat protein